MFGARSKEIEGNTQTHEEIRVSKMESSTAVSSETTILHLNDDCLLGVFEYFDSRDLYSVANVCTRFRENAQIQYLYSKFNNAYEVRVDSPHGLLEKLLKVERFLRSFGVCIKTIDLMYSKVLHFDNYARHPAMVYINQIFKLLNRYCCGGALTKLMIDGSIFMTDDINCLVRPIFQHLQILKLRECQLSKSFASELSQWAPNLRELECSYIIGPNVPITNRKRFFGNTETPRFPKLERLSINAVPSVNNKHIQRFLKWNPQLKHIELFHCSGVNEDTFRSIAKYVPKIETILYCATKPRIYDFEHFGHFSNLKSLRLKFSGKRWKNLNLAFFNMMAVLYEIDMANIPLEHLRLENIVVIEHDAFINAISNLKKLKTLGLISIAKSDERNFNIVEICKRLTELTEIYFLRRENSGHPYYFTRDSACRLSAADLLEMIRNAKKLEILCIVGYNSSKEVINSDTYEEMLTISETERDTEAPLKIILSDRCFKPYFETIEPHESLTLIISEIISRGFFYANDLHSYSDAYYYHHRHILKKFRLPRK